jgi:transposase
MLNERIRQTYFGVLNILSGKVWIKPYPTANALNSEDFLKHLLQRNPGKKITVCWDKVSSHDSKRVKCFVRDINRGLSKKQRRLTIVWLPLAAPEENPMEDVWLYGKTAIRKDPEDLLSFEDVKQRFEKALKNRNYSPDKTDSPSSTI